uniref:hypothetical protein n=1 Tax=Sphingomonas bacterium TaxID=1895847 RepID=UPI00157756D4
MESLASTAIYLASSLTVAQVPGATPPAKIFVVTTSTGLPPTQEVRAGLADVVVMTNPFTSARNAGRKSLDEAIIDEVRRDALDQPSGAARMDPSSDPDRDDLDKSLSKDITAAHDARIDFIERRMDELRLQGVSAAPLVDRLGVKLRLAMAARRLALAREAIVQLPAGCDLSPDACRPIPIAVAASTVTDHRGYGHVRPRSSAPHRQGPARILVDASVAAAPSPSNAVIVTIGAAAGRGVKRVADSHSSHRASGGSDRLAGSAIHLALAQGTRHRPTDGTVHGSDRARRLLAT